MAAPKITVAKSRVTVVVDGDTGRGCRYNTGVLVDTGTQLLQLYSTCVTYGASMLVSL